MKISEDDLIRRLNEKYPKVQHCEAFIGQDENTLKLLRGASMTNKEFVKIIRGEIDGRLEMSEQKKGKEVISARDPGFSSECAEFIKLENFCPWMAWAIVALKPRTLPGALPRTSQ